MTAKKDEIRRAAILALAASVCLLLVSCTTSGPAKPSRSAAFRPASDLHAPEILASKTWYLSGFRSADGFVPIQPGQGSSALVILKRDGTIEGTTGINQFAGTWSLGNGRSGAYAFSAKVRTTTRHEPPNDIAARFDRDILALINRADTLKITKDSISLENGRDGILLGFIHY
jgi:heat shock protein HslJ